jgi:hypothetical protein
VKPNKGDLVLVSDGSAISTCIVLTDIFNVTTDPDKGFYYTLCIETGLYGIIYDHEITSIVCEGFAPDYEFKSELFETDYSHYADLYEGFSYFPLVWSLDDESSEED